MLSQQHLLDLLKWHNPATTAIKAVKNLGGSCADFTSKVETDAGSFFLKYYNHPAAEAEARGLELLRSTHTVCIPETLGYGKWGEYHYVLLEWIDQGPRNKSYWEELGENLAQLHKISNENYGLDHDNFIGKLPQLNQYKKSWVQFYIENRLMPQLKMAQSVFSSKELDLFNQLFSKLPQLLPEESPSLIHGDLWSGNVLINVPGNPVLIDPAVYYAHREIEIAFTGLFGGFPDEFYQAYQSTYPLLQNYDQRVDLYHLYPLLVHVNMFAGGYVRQVKAILNRFVR